MSLSRLFFGLLDHYRIGSTSQVNQASCPGSQPSEVLRLLRQLQVTRIRACDGVAWKGAAQTINSIPSQLLLDATANGASTVFSLHLEWEFMTFELGQRSRYCLINAAECHRRLRQLHIAGELELSAAAGPPAIDASMSWSWCYEWAVGGSPALPANRDKIVLASRCKARLAALA